MIEFNVNHYVYVKLTDSGRAALKERHDKLNKRCGMLLGEYAPPKEDDEGWSKWQMWELFEKLGSEFGLGLSPPISTEIRLEEESK